MIDLDSTPDLSEFYNVRLISKYSQELARLEEESINDSKLPTHYIHLAKAEYPSNIDSEISPRSQS
jgi:hypothetical protein